jgi:hypothetical protein
MANSFNQAPSDTAARHDTSMEDDNKCTTTEIIGTSQPMKKQEMWLKATSRSSKPLSTRSYVVGSEVTITGDKAKKTVTACFPEYQCKFTIHHHQGNEKQEMKA